MNSWDMCELLKENETAFSANNINFGENNSVFQKLKNNFSKEQILTFVSKLI